MTGKVAFVLQSSLLALYSMFGCVRADETQSCISTPVPSLDLLLLLLFLLLLLVQVNRNHMEDMTTTCV